MEVITAGPGVLSTNNGIVSEINGNQVVINDKQYDINIKDATDEKESNIFPVKSTWQRDCCRSKTKKLRKRIISQRNNTDQIQC